MTPLVGFSMPDPFSILQIIVGLGFVVFVHELGHFLVAKWAGVLVERFSLGFGPKLLAVRRGETEYCISAIPLGGYVKMAGETPEDEKKGDPREFAAQPARWRAAILMAGVAMNGVAAVPLLALAISLGGTFRANQTSLIGSVAPGSAAERAGVKPGDRIVAVNDESVSRWLELEALRAGEAIGLSNIWVDRIGEFSAEKLPALAGAAPGERIATVNGAPWTDQAELRAAILDHPNGTLTLELALGPESTAPLRRVSLPIGAQIQHECGFAIEPHQDPVIGEVSPGGPAEKGGLKPGDKVLAIGGHPIASWTELRGAIQMSTSDTVRVEIEREAKPLTLVVSPSQDHAGTALALSLELLRGTERRRLEIPASDTGRRIGIVQGHRVSRVTSEGAAALHPGDILLAARFQPETGEPADWPITNLTTPSVVPGRLTITVLRGGQKIQADVVLSPKTVGQIAFPAGYSERVHPREGWGNPAALAAASLRESLWILRFNVNNLMNLGRSITRGQAHMLEQLSGPLGIGAMTYVSIRNGYSPYFWMLGLISLALAIMNVLPIPLLDGGHLLFLVLEKIRGKPVSETIQVYAQYTALAALLSLVLLATWNDIHIIDKLQRLTPR